MRRNGSCSWYSQGFRGSLIALLSAVCMGSMGLLANGYSNQGNKKPKISADPWVFVGKADECGDPYPAGSAIVTSGWLRGMGLPDNGLLNNNINARKDPRLGLLLNKNGLTSDCSSAGATIKGVKGMVVTAGFTLGYDYRNGGHCGAGAPRFNVDTDQGFFFVGCANAPQQGAVQDPPEWSETRSDVTACGVECFPSSIPVGAKIKSIDIVFDEGTDTANNDTQGVGLAVLDNIYIDGILIRSGSGLKP